MKKTKKLLSLFLSLLMVLSSLSALPLEALADWEDNKLCYNCGEWTDDYCDNCGSDRYCIFSSCHDIAHCEICDGCYLNYDCEPCDDGCMSIICKDCAAEAGFHCVDCGACFMGSESEDLCQECGRCANCIDGELCDVCHICTECNFHCPECGECDAEPCPSGSEEHCYEECEICESCGECMLANGVEPCEYCGLCPDCCEANACPDCEMCVENPEYDDHICENCGACLEVNDMCETCGWCLDCCLSEAISMGCECGEYCHEELDDSHFCKDCGSCFGIVDACETCEKAGEYRCVDCCGQLSNVKGCDCASPVCINDPDWTEHFKALHDGSNPSHTAKPQAAWSMDYTYHWKDCKYCDEDSHITAKAKHTFDKLGKCTTCGYVKNASIIITKQPSSRSVDVPDVNVPVEDWPTPVFNVTAKSLKPLTYQLQYSGYKNFSTVHNFKNGDGWADNVTTNSLRMMPTEEWCYALYGTNDNEFYVRCAISDGMQTVYSNVATLRVNHVFDSKEMKVTAEGHQIKCRGDGCEEYSKLQRHTYDKWTWNTERTERTATCTVCGYKATVEAHRHSMDFFAPDAEAYQLTNSKTREYTAKVVDKTYIIDRYHHECTCQDPDCDYVISQAHNWGPWQKTNTTPTSATVKSGLYRECKECGFQDDILRKDKDGNDLYWEFGVHPINVIGGTMDDPNGMIREGDTITLTPDKKDGYVFTGWKIEYEELYFSTYQNKGNIVYLSSSTVSKIRAGFNNYLTQFTMPKYNDAGVWTFTALYNEGCTHKNTEIVGKTEATCGHFGYTGDTVCADCGHLIERGQELDKLPHQHVHTVTKDIPLTDSKGNRVYKRNGDPVYLARAYDEGDCNSGLRGYTGDTICDDCGKIVEHGKAAMFHHLEVEEVLSQPSTTSKGRALYCCYGCGLEKEMSMDYTGPDYSVTPSVRRVNFNFTYGKDTQPIIIDFNRTGRNADEIVKITSYEYALDNNVVIKQTGDMQITVEPNYSTLGEQSDFTNLIDVSFQLKDGSHIWLSNQNETQDAYIPVNINVLKTKETYTINLIGAGIYDHDSKMVTEAPQQFHAGDSIRIDAADKKGITGWLVINDASGYVKEHVDIINSEFSPTIDKTLYIMMPQNDVTILALDSTTKDGWKQVEGKWLYIENNKLATGWKQIKNVWYYFDSNGIMQTGWQKISNKWYYFASGGAMQTGWQKISNKWYYFASGGAMQTGWQKIGSAWYYFASGGAMQTGWQKIGGAWYYFKSSGAMVTGWQKLSNKWYYFQSGGKMQTGWLKLGGNWYYFESSGAMLANTSRKIGAKTYRFNSSGVCTNP